MWKVKKKYFVEGIFWDSILSSSGNGFPQYIQKKEMVRIPGSEMLLVAREVFLK